MNELENNLGSFERPSSFLPFQGQGVSSSPPSGDLGVSSINLKPEHLKIVKEILFKFIPNTEVWAFGSRVKFTNAEFADLDLVIVGEKKQSLTTMADLEEAFEESDLPFEVDILDYCSIAEHLKKEINKKYMKLIDPKSVKEGYKDTPLGLIPKDWEVVRLGDVCDVRDGTHDSPKYQSFGIKLLTSKNIKNGAIDWMETNCISLEDASNINKRSQVHKGDILISMIGTVGNAVLVKEEPDFCIKNVGLFKPQNIQSLFLFYFFQSPLFQENIQKKLGGSTQKFLALGTLRDLTSPLPPLEEQKKIAEILSTWDQGIDKLSGLIERKKHLKKGLMQKLLTGRVRTPNPLKGGFKEIERPISSSPPSGDLGVSFPEDWEIVRLGDVFERLVRKNTGNKSLNVLTISAQHGLINQQKFFNKAIASQNITSYYLIHKGEYAYNKSYSAGYEWGAIKRLNNYDNGVLSTLYICFRVNSPEAYSDFYEHYFNACLFDSEIALIAQEGARNHGLLNIAIEDFFNVKIPFPPLEEQKKIAEILSTQDKEIDKLEKKLELFKQQKKGLMQILLTGRVRTPNPLKGGLR